MLTRDTTVLNFHLNGRMEFNAEFARRVPRIGDLVRLPMRGGDPGGREDRFVLFRVRRRSVMEIELDPIGQPGVGNRPVLAWKSEQWCYSGPTDPQGGRLA